MAGVSVEMAYPKDFVVVRLTGKPFLKNPPLYCALGATVSTVFGKDNDLSYRLVSILFAGLTLLTTFRPLRALFSCFRDPSARAAAITNV